MARSRDRQNHALRLLDRGEQHTHRWHATCVCGWVGKFRRRHQEAAGLYREHLRSKTRLAKRERPRRPTPRADLPEVLR